MHAYIVPTSQFECQDPHSWVDISALWSAAGPHHVSSPWLCGTHGSVVLGCALGLFSMQLLEPAELPISEIEICLGEQKYNGEKIVASLILEMVFEQCRTN